MLVVFAGRSGTGKTTLARAIAQEMKAVYLRVDTIEQALRDSVELAADVGAAGYIVGYRLAQENLRLGLSVVADSVNPLQITRDAWIATGGDGSAVVEVEVICSDEMEHRKRLEARSLDIPGLPSTSWQAALAREYEAWPRSHIIVDTANKSAEAAVKDLLEQIQRAHLR